MMKEILAKLDNIVRMVSCNLPQIIIKYLEVFVQGKLKVIFGRKYKIQNVK